MRLQLTRDPPPNATELKFKPLATFILLQHCIFFCFRSRSNRVLASSLILLLCFYLHKSWEVPSIVIFPNLMHSDSKYSLFEYPSLPEVDANFRLAFQWDFTLRLALAPANVEDDSWIFVFCQIFAGSPGERLLRERLRPVLPSAAPLQRLCGQHLRCPKSAPGESAAFATGSIVKC